MRQVGNAVDNRTLDLQIVMAPTRAKAIAVSQLYRAYAERDRSAVVLPRKYLYLDPVDVIVAEGRQYRILEQTATPPGLLKQNLVPHLASLLLSSGIGSTGGFIPQTVASKAATEALFLDIPLVVDTDHPYGFYQAVQPATAGSWAGESTQ